STPGMIMTITARSTPRKPAITGTATRGRPRPVTPLTTPPAASAVRMIARSSPVSAGNAQAPTGGRQKAAPRVSGEPIDETSIEPASEKFVCAAAQPRKVDDRGAMACRKVDRLRPTEARTKLLLLLE